MCNVPTCIMSQCEECHSMHHITACAKSQHASCHTMQHVIVCNMSQHAKHNRVQNRFNIMQHALEQLQSMHLSPNPSSYNSPVCPHADLRFILFIHTMISLIIVFFLAFFVESCSETNCDGHLAQRRQAIVQDLYSPKPENTGDDDTVVRCCEGVPATFAAARSHGHTLRSHRSTPNRKITTLGKLAFRTTTQKRQMFQKNSFAVTSHVYYLGVLTS